MEPQLFLWSYLFTAQVSGLLCSTSWPPCFVRTKPSLSIPELDPDLKLELDLELDLEPEPDLEPELKLELGQDPDLDGIWDGGISVGIQLVEFCQVWFGWDLLGFSEVGFRQDAVGIWLGFLKIWSGFSQVGMWLGFVMNYQQYWSNLISQCHSDLNSNLEFFGTLYFGSD